MKRRLLVLAAIFAATYVIASATKIPMTIAVFVTVAVGFCWLVARDLRRPSWAESQRAQDAVYGVAMIAALHTPGQSSADCPSGVDGGFSSGADCGGFGV